MLNRNFTRRCPFRYNLTTATDHVNDKEPTCAGEVFDGTNNHGTLEDSLPSYHFNILRATPIHLLFILGAITTTQAVAVRFAMAIW